MSWVDYMEKSKTTDLAILPVGATEGYGPHLPLGSDSLVSSAVAARVAERAGCFVAPSINYGYSEELMGYPGTLSISTTTLTALLKDVVWSLHRQGISRLFYICGHIGNLSPINQVAFDAKRDLGMESAVVDWWRFVFEINRDLMEGTIPEGHASEVGTSVLLHLFPALTVPERSVSEMPPEGLVDIPRLEVFTYFHKLSKSAVWGDPTRASAEKGKAMIDRAVDTLAGFLEHWSHATFKTEVN
jgi:creatinine amidohydrolase